MAPGFVWMKAMTAAPEASSIGGAHFFVERETFSCVGAALLFLADAGARQITASGSRA